MDFEPAELVRDARLVLNVLECIGSGTRELDVSSVLMALRSVEWRVREVRGCLPRKRSRAHTAPQTQASLSNKDEEAPRFTAVVNNAGEGDALQALVGVVHLDDEALAAPNSWQRHFESLQQAIVAARLAHEHNMPAVESAIAKMLQECDSLTWEAAKGEQTT